MNGIEDILSIASFAVEIYDNLNINGIGTAFFIRRNNELFLITNWHIVTNRNAFTNITIGKFVPHQLIASVPLLKDKRIIFAKLSVPLIDKVGLPLWKTHPLFKSHHVDIVSIKVENRDDVIPINEIPTLRPIKVSIGEEVTINGFPLGLEFGPYPIFKKGFIATEPNVDLKDLPIILVDSATRSGMSGSPVFVSRTDTYTQDITNDTVMEGGIECPACGEFLEFELDGDDQETENDTEE